MKSIILTLITLVHFGIFSQKNTLNVKPPNILSNSIRIEENEIIKFGGPEASFPGGYDSLRIFIKEHFACFPDSLQERSSEKIWIRFVVEKMVI